MFFVGSRTAVLTANRTQGRHLRLISLIALFTFSIIFFHSSWMEGLQPTTRITQYGHTAWRLGQSGLDAGPIVITQSTDGYIWAGTTDGLFRFDGVRFTRWLSEAGEDAPHSVIRSILGASDGSLYVGTETGMYRLSHGHFYHYPEKLMWVTSIFQDKQGNVWTGDWGNRPDSSTMCRVGETHISCLGMKDGFSCMYGISFTSDKADSIWIGGTEGICHWHANEKPENYPLSSIAKTNEAVWSIAADAQGSLWATIPAMGQGKGLLKFDAGAWKTYMTSEVDGGKLSARTLLFDRDENLWIGTETQGLYRLSSGKLSHFDTTDGLSGNTVKSVFEDREGTLWVVTDQGLDSFHDQAVISFTTREGLSDNTPNDIATDLKGDVWVGTSHLLNRFHNQQFDHIQKGLPADGLQYLLADSHGHLWVASGRRLYLYDDGRFSVVMNGTSDEVGQIIEMVEDTHHQVWASVQDLKSREGNALYRIEGANVVERVHSPTVAENQQFGVLAPNPHGGIWVAGNSRGLYWFHDGDFEQVKPGGFEGRVDDLTGDTDGSLWIETDEGVILYRDNKARALTSREGLPCETSLSTINDHAGSHWFFLSCGIVRILDVELEHWWKDPTYQMRMTIYNTFDGAQPRMRGERPSVAPDGKLWSVNGNAVQMIDPSHLPFNPIPPPVHIERLMVGQSDFPLQSGLRLPASPREVQIDYTGLSFVVPERVRFRYQLVGHDKDWTDAGTRRLALYNDLSPGNYTFRVTACNNDGVWNSQGDELRFTIPPAWYQTLWFRLLCVFFLFGVGYALYRIRMRQYAASMKMRFDERLEERTRLARDLHDTLLQTIQGSRLVAEQAVGSDETTATTALKRISTWLERAVDEGRAALESLRTSTTEGNNLAAGFREVFEECNLKLGAKLELSVIGVSKEMHPIARDEVYRIGYEAIRNVCIHSGAKHVKIICGKTSSLRPNGHAGASHANRSEIDDRQLAEGNESQLECPRRGHL